MSSWQGGRRRTSQVVGIFLGVLFFAGLTVPGTLQANGASTIFKALSRPVSRFLLQYTQEGSALSRRLIGYEIHSDDELQYLARTLSQSERAAEARALLSRLDALEAEARAAMRAGRISDVIAWIEQRAAERLSLSQGRQVRFVDPAPARGFSANRQRFLEGASSAGAADDAARLPAAGADLAGLDFPSLQMAGADLRFTRWKGRVGGDLKNADFRGADLSEAVVDAATKLDGAVYDQYTRLPFSKAEASRRGMVYRGSTPPTGSIVIDLEGLQEGVQRAAAQPPQGIEELPARLLPDLPGRFPQEFRHVQPLTTPEFVRVQGASWVSFESGKITGSDDAFIQGIIEEAERLGGEVRRLSAARATDGALLRHGMAYFRPTRDGAVIALGLAADSRTVAHEMTHFRDWLALVQKHRSSGLNADQAFERSLHEFATPEFVRYTERRAVISELKRSHVLDEAKGVPLAERRYRYEHREFVSTLSYPEREAIGRIFGRFRLQQLEAESALAPLLVDAERYARTILRRGLIARRNWYRNLRMQSAAEIDFEPFFFEVVSSNRLRYASTGSLDDVKTFFQRFFRSEVERLPDDEFRAAILARLSR